jgi:alpha-L-rhamnosidase
MGNYLRMDILSRYGLQAQMLGEIQDYFYKMASATGTLWEHMQDYASCNHGFASYLGHILYRDALGISHIDYHTREITIRFADIGLDECQGVLPLNDEFMELKWKRSGNEIHYSLRVPADYTVKIVNNSPFSLVSGG